MPKTKIKHLNCLDTKESIELIDMPKSYDQNVAWKKGNNANYLIAQFIPYDSSDSLKGTIPGVSVQVDYKRPIRIKSSNKTVITLFKLKKGTKLRAYQVEACDEEKISSRNGDEIVYGCHEHIGK